MTVKITGPLVPNRFEFGECCLVQQPGLKSTKETCLDQTDIDCFLTVWGAYCKGEFGECVFYSRDGLTRYHIARLIEWAAKFGCDRSSSLPDQGVAPCEVTKMRLSELSEILRCHDLWVHGKSVGGRANLCEADLHGADLSGADLSGADLSGAYLYGANLSGAYLYGANLREADLRGAYLREADLREADLSGAYLYGANLYGANLSGANLRGANLRGAYLSGANLSGADLSGANLNWQSHSIISEVLRQSAGTSADRRALAGLVSVSTDWCWPIWLTQGSLGALEGEREWAIEMLRRYVRWGDDAPGEIAWEQRGRGGALVHVDEESP